MKTDIAYPKYTEIQWLWRVSTTAIPTTPKHWSHSRNRGLKLAPPWPPLGVLTTVPLIP